MDIRKIIVSREKSIVKLDAEIHHLELEIQTAKAAGNFPAAVSLKGLVDVRAQRKARLLDEVKALTAHVAATSRQLEVPGTSASSSGEPPAPGPVAGKGRR